MPSVRAYLMARFYDASMRKTEQLCLSDWRAELLAQARGEVLEVGGGTGINLPYYPANLNRVILSEPDRHMRQQLAAKLPQAAGRSFQLTEWSAEAIPLPDASLDTIVCTLVLCSVPEQARSLAELYRVLRPGGQLLYLEHVIAEDPALQRWQRLVTPIWKSCCGNCHLTRDTGRALEEAGFRHERQTEAQMLGAPAIARRTIRGCARKPNG